MPHEVAPAANALPSVSTPQRLSDPESSDTQSPTSSSPSRMDKPSSDGIVKNNTNNSEDDEGVALPESTQQPFLNADNYVPATLPPRTSERSSSRRHRKGSLSTGSSGSGGNDEDALFSSPRSIDMKKAETMPLPVSGVTASLQDAAQQQQPQQPQSKSRERSGRSGRKEHRRVSSDGVHLMRHGLDPYSAAATDPFMQQMHMQQQQMQYQQQQQYMQQQQQQYMQLQPPLGPLYAPASMGGGVYLAPPGVRSGGHNRVQSWQGAAPIMDPNFMQQQLHPQQQQQAHQQQQQQQQPQNVRSSRRHRRVNSDGMTPVKEEDENLHETDQSPPPQMLHGQSPTPYPSTMHNFPGSPTFPSHSLPRSLPGRTMQGWSSDPQLVNAAYNRGMPAPPSTVGYPPPNNLQQQQQQHQPPLPQQGYDQQQQQQQQPQMMGGSPNFQQMKPKRTRRKNRQRSASSNAAIPGLYGSFFHGSADAADTTTNQSVRPSEFNARSEIMSLTSSFRSPKVVFQTNSPKTGSGSSHGKHYRHGSFDGVYDESMPLVPNINVPLDGGEAAFTAQRKTKSKALQSMRTAQTLMHDVKGVPQEAACRNVLFLLLFLFHLVGMAYIGNTYGRDTVVLQKSSWDDNTNVVIDIHRVIYVASISGAFAVVVSALALVMMTIIARRFVQVALFLLIAMSFAWGTIGIGVSSRNLVPITGFIALALSVGYTFVVWERIPFHAANLATALTAVRANAGAILIACVCQLLALAWANYYVYAIAGVYGAMETGQLHLSHKMKTFVYVMFGISFYWTFNVLLNIVQVTVAGVVGKWWYQPSGTRSFCSNNVTKPFCHAAFYSLGSICCGSLLVGPVRLLRQFSAFFRPSNDVNTLMCMQQCLHCIQSCVTTCVDYIADGLNPWAFTYVGLYGYGFVDAGRNATELFKKREWTMIISDDILPNILLMMSLVIGGITGCFAFLIENLDFLKIARKEDLGTLTFSLGLVVGLVLTSVLFGMISSSVNAVIVCFASSPVDFENNHPDLSNEMRYAWREVWPGSMDVVDGRINLAQFDVGRDYLLA